IVGTQSLLVYETVSLEKQIAGYEVGFGVFRFFGSELFDINMGAKNQEPLQLGVRTAIEAGIFDLVASITKADSEGCSSMATGAWKSAMAAGVSAVSATA